MSSRPAKILVCLVIWPLLLPACSSAPQHEVSGKAKEEPSAVPLEFRNGTATLAQAKAWFSAMRTDQCLPPKELVHSEEADLTFDGRRHVVGVYDPSNEGTGGHMYLLFEKTSRGLAFLGDMNGHFRAVPADSAGNPRLVSYWHLGSSDNRITLYTLSNGSLVETAHRTVRDGNDDRSTPEDNQLVADLFDASAVSPELITRAFHLVK